MKRNKIGSVEIQTERLVFVCDKPFSEMRQNEVRIFSHLDLLQEKAVYATEDEQNAIYTEMDKYYTIACICDQFGNNEDYLLNASAYFNDKVSNGEFDKDFASLEDRNENINNIVSEIINNTLNNYKLSSILTYDKLEWWRENIINLNYYTLADGTKSKVLIKDVAINGTTANYVEEFKKTACGWAYLHCDKSLIKNSKIAVSKYARQKTMQNAINDSNIQLDTTTQNNLIKSGIIKDTQGGDANDFVKALKEEGQKKSTKIGGLTAALITAIITLVCTALSVIGGIVQQRIASKSLAYSSDVVNPGNACDPSDFSGMLDDDGDGKIDTKYILLGIGLLGTIYYYLS